MNEQRAGRLRSVALGIVLFTALAAIYLLFYRGHPLSIDEISTFDSVESLTQHGTLSRTIEFYRQPTIGANGSPFLPPLYEPMQILAASPFYLLAQASPHLGQIHTVFLLNVAVTALTAVRPFGLAPTVAPTTAIRPPRGRFTQRRYAGVPIAGFFACPSAASACASVSRPISAACPEPDRS